MDLLTQARSLIPDLAPGEKVNAVQMWNAASTVLRKKYPENTDCFIGRQKHPKLYGELETLFRGLQESYGYTVRKSKKRARVIAKKEKTPKKSASSAGAPPRKRVRKNSIPTAKPLEIDWEKINAERPEEALKGTKRWFAARKIVALQYPHISKVPTAGTPEHATVQMVSNYLGKPKE